MCFLLQFLLIVEMSFGLGRGGRGNFGCNLRSANKWCDYSKHYIPVLQKGGERNGMIKF